MDILGVLFFVEFYNEEIGGIDNCEFTDLESAMGFAGALDKAGGIPTRVFDSFGIDYM